MSITLTLIFDAATKIIPVISTAAIAWRRYSREPKVKRKTRDQQKLDQLSAFLAFDIRHRDRLVVEQQFRIFFSGRIDYLEIVCLLGAKRQLTAFTFLPTARPFVIFNESEGHFAFRNLYSTQTKRRIWKASFFAVYCFLCLAAFLPWSTLDFERSGWQSVFALSVLCAMSFWAAWGSLTFSADLSIAEKFVDAAKSAEVTAPKLRQAANTANATNSPHQASHPQAANRPG
ncbi:hypothetical protein PI93_017505 [Pandoraea fibrosis]|uniref:Uncharacterized protein n=1 Tax=Pandoraea fibrosis TaxID=1891094 RepID=A0ABX6HUS3_9BURK|nr:hypothetical protein [Pandoraea fibrosis]QHE92198.1 hypothetical protein PJ20_010495 [Pandoraea fibrosis]QHF14245.1 hypothetical protein PI93_017505 [Pandoraea fibrosis]